jgi:hypothetical protein
MATYPNTTSASDIWSLRDVYKAEAGDEWPSIVVPSSYSFNGTDSVLEFTDSALELGNYNSFTIECWHYSLTSNQNYGSSIFCNSINSQYHSVSIGYDNSGNLTFNHSESGSWDILFAQVVAQANLLQNQWVHIALVWDGSQVRIYYNGTYAYSASTSTMHIKDDFRIGRYNQSFEGYISNLRIVTNNVLYTGTGTITVPTEPLTAISGTQLLTCATDSVEDLSSNALTPTVNTTNVSIVSQNPFS